MFMGCRKHKSVQVAVTGAFGLVCLIAGVVFCEVVGELGEKLLTLLGATLLALAHFQNYRLCQKQACTDCGQQHEVVSPNE